ncbi:MAG: signal peptidase II [Legionella sp.]|jgi:signal peptidase II
MRQGYWFFLSIAVLILDQLSKYWVSLNLIPYTPVPIIPMFNLTLAYNTGAAFSFLSAAGTWHHWFFAVFGVLVCIILIIWLLRSDSMLKLQSVAISLILGGAVGNLIDRALHGHVIDFIDLYYKHYHFATFNIADSAICIGAALLILDLFIQGE